MKQINIITGNSGKFKDIQNFLNKQNIKTIQINIDLEEIQDIDPIRVLTHKASNATKLGYSNFLLEDTSLYIDGLKKLPGPFIKFFLQELKLTGLTKLAQAMGNQKAWVETIFAYVNSQKNCHYFKGQTKGKIVPAKGTKSFGWSSIFQPEGSSKTYGEMSLEDKEEFSQRTKALKKFLGFIQN